MMQQQRLQENDRIFSRLVVAHSNNKKKKRRKKVWFWSPECRYSVILNNVKDIGWKLVDDTKKESSANIYWIDVASIHERFRSIQPWQIINHFPGMPNIARKNRMGQNLNRMLKLFPKQYKFYPRTWVLPSEIADFRTQFDGNGNAIGNKIYIIKPDGGCQGRGIFLTKTFDSVPKGENVVAQVYIKNPLLLDGFKFDLRLYCLVTSVKPLRMYLFDDGLVRICTEEYVKPNKQNIDNVCMHLTNYAVNKHNSNFQQPSAKSSSDEDQDDGNKRSLVWFYNRVKEEKGEAKAEWLKRRMGTLCVRTVMSIMPTLAREYDQHFKGFSSVPLNPKTKVPNRQPSAQVNRNVTSVFTKPHNKDDNGNDNNDDDDGDDEDEDGEEDDNEEDEEEDAAAAASSCSHDCTPPPPSSTCDEDDSRTRGSRCFEILGFDVMLTDKYRPVLIEVNHLPSFGTDSPLDLDIKTRLMQQVMQTIPALPDDEAAHFQYHKEASEQRLTGPTVPSKGKDEGKVVPNKDKNATANSSSNASNSSKQQQQLPSKCSSNSDTPKAIESISSATTTTDTITAVEVPPLPIVMHRVHKKSRIEEIKQLLHDIYAVHRPDKIPKIDKLLVRYIGLEEQFVEYVHEKYNVPYTPASIIEDNDEIVIASLQSAKETGPMSSHLPKPPSHAKATAAPKRSARSLSPPGGSKAKSVARQVPTWKQIHSEEAAQYRVEILNTYKPLPDDPWMLQETKLLTQFVRIYPEKQRDDLSAIAVDEDDRDDASETDEAVSNAIDSSSQSASYDDILFQIFMEDKRQTMRMHHPLPRGRPPSEGANNSSSSSNGRDSNSLPPLSKSRGVAVDKRDDSNANKQPTQRQSDTIDRLFKGFSAKNRSSSKGRADSDTDASSADTGDSTAAYIAATITRATGKKKASPKKKVVNPVLRQQLFSF